MKHICRTLLGGALLLGGLTASAQSGLEGIIVEEYYTITEADASYLAEEGNYAITAGTKVYRVYVDMAPGWKLNDLTGDPLPQGGGVSPNPLDFTTTTLFWNSVNHGSEVAPNTRDLDEGAAFDSYFTIGRSGAAGGGAAGCGQNTQQLGVLRTADSNGNLTLCGVYEGFPDNTVADGNIPGSAPGATFAYNLGNNENGSTFSVNTLSGWNDDFTEVYASGSFQVIGDNWAWLPNGAGVDPAGTNRVLIAQLTTDGDLSFHINLSLQSADNSTLEIYKWGEAAGAGQYVSPFLTYPLAGTPDCNDVPNGPALPGTGCDDEDACTIDDIWSPECVCAGTFQDTDQDGTCDVEDGCPFDADKTAAGVCGCGNDEPGTACDDGNEATENDVIGENCQCAGTALPLDCEGTPGGTVLPGTACDDDDACTINDVYDLNCVCAGTFEDTDEDGTCDANDGCPEDPNKIAAGICGCGVADTDTDEDGDADCNDPCPALADLVNGDPCDDDNANTIDDTVVDCVCVGTLLGDDCEGVPGGPAQPGTACDDEEACTINDVYDVNCACAGTFEDTDEDGTCDANDGCPTDPDKIAAGVCGCGVPDTDTDEDGDADCIDSCPLLADLVNGDPCDDGNANTENDTVVNCVCVGTDPGEPDCEGVIGGPAQPGTICDDEEACTINDVYDVNCVCAGTFQDSDEDEVCDANDGCPNDSNKIAAGLCGCGNPEPGTACDDLDNTTVNDQINANCQCEGTPLDVDCEGTPGGTALPGTACDDGDENTDGDTWSNGCVCVGEPIWDCPVLEANIGDACDDGDTGTEGDVVDANCECHGTLVYDCPDLEANIGDDCDDQDANTTNDEVDANCECHGTSVGDCTQNLVLEISLDGNPGEVTWTVYDESETGVLATGGLFAAGQANTTVTEEFCVPVGNYHLEVSDAGNNGGSAYVLRTEAGKRIIDATMGSYASTSEIGGPFPARSFTVPLWNHALLATWCDRPAQDRQAPLYCNSQPGATGYQWWFFDPHGSYNRRVVTTNPTIVPNHLQTFPIPNSVWLNVRVRAVMPGSAFGPACRMRFVPHGSQGTSRELLYDEATNVSMSLYPNPNHDGQVTVYMEGVDVADATMIDIDVYDMVGKRVFAERATAAEGILNHRMDLGAGIGAGVYMVHVTIEGKPYIQRLVIQ